MMSDLLRQVVSGGYNNFNQYLASPNYVAYGKSGTSSWEEEGAMYGIPAGVMKDEWSLGYTSTYSIATWSGYLEQWFKQGYYMGLYELNAAPAFHLNHYMLDYLETGGDYHAIEQPDGVSNYNGGYIKTEFLSKGDKSSYYQPQNPNPSADDATQSELNKAQRACTASGGTFDNGACTCPNGYELNGTACQPAVQEPDETEEPVPDQEETENPDDSDISGEENGDETDHPSHPDHQGSATGAISPWMLPADGWRKEFFA